MRSLAWPAMLLSLAFDGLKAATIKREQLGDVLLRLGRGGRIEAGGTGGGLADVGNSGDEFQKVQRDVFIAARAERAVGECIHSEFSETRFYRMRGATLKRMETAYIGLGGNVASAAGEPETTLAVAAERLATLGRVVRRSRLYLTAPVGFQDQPRFVNAAVALETPLSAPELLDALLAIEREFGRDRSAGISNGPRTLDLDILLYGDHILNTRGLELPHPRLAERAFVLVPLSEIAPDAVVPGIHRSVKELLESLKRNAMWDANAVVAFDSDLRTGA